jgi:hypothetical protein
VAKLTIYRAFIEGDLDVLRHLAGIPVLTVVLANGEVSLRSGIQVDGPANNSAGILLDRKREPSAVSNALYLERRRGLLYERCKDCPLGKRWVTGNSGPVTN